MDTGVFSGANSGLFGTDNYVSRSTPRTGVSSFLDALSTVDKEHSDRKSDRKTEVSESSDKQTGDKAHLDRKTLNHYEERSSDMRAEYDKRIERATSSGQRVAGSERSGASNELRASSDELRIASCEYQVTGGERQIARNEQNSINTVTNNPQLNTRYSILDTSNSPLPVTQVLPPTGTHLASVKAALPTTTTAATSAVTIFTAAHHLTASANSSAKSEEEDNEHSGDEEDNKEKKRKKKKTPFAAVTALLPRTEQLPLTYKRNHGIGERNASDVQYFIDRSAGAGDKGNVHCTSTAVNNTTLLDSPETISVAEQEHQRFLQRITAACETAVQHNAPIRMKVNLDQLGTLSIELKQQANKISLHFSTPSKAAARFIAENLVELKKMLAERGLCGNIEIDAAVLVRRLQ